MTHPKRYVDVLEDVLKSKVLGTIPARRGNARAIYQLLAKRAHRDTTNEDQYRKCFPLQSTIADELGLTRQLVVHEIGQLVRAGLLRREKLGGNRYVYEIPELWELLELAAGGRAYMNGNRRMTHADVERMPEQTNVSTTLPYPMSGGADNVMSGGADIRGDSLYIEGSKMPLEREVGAPSEREVPDPDLLARYADYRPDDLRERIARGTREMKVAAAYLLAQIEG